MDVLQVPKKIWINGRLADPRRPLLSVFDRGFLYGDGVYETLRIYGGRPFRFDAHARRLVQSARGIGIALPVTREALLRAVRSVIRANGMDESSIRITLSRGAGPLGFDARGSRRPTLLITPGPTLRRDPAVYERGASIVIARTRRMPPEALPPSLKTTNSLNNILAKREAVAAGVDDAVMLNMRGMLAEGTASNVFFIKGRRLFTPSMDCGILDGVTRRDILTLAAARGLRCVEGRFRPARLLSADEVFLSSTTVELLPVTTVIDDDGRRHTINGGRVGRWAGLLRSDYAALVAREGGGQ